MKEVVYWARDIASLPPVTPAGQEPPEAVDVAVVGAGVTGLCAALSLARGGASVAVFDTHTVGWGASGRNGGMVSAGGKRPLASWIKAFGHDFAHRLYKATEDSVTFVEKTVKKEKIDCGYRRCGGLSAAWKPAHFGGLADYQRRLLEETGHKTKLIAPVDQDKELGTRSYHGALLDKSAACLDPFAYARGLAAAAVRAGALVFENTEVTGLQPAAGGHLVSSSRGGLRAAEVLVATNAYTGGITPRLQRRVVPIESQIIATEPLDEELALSCIPMRRNVYDTKQLLFYYRLSDDDRMLFGGRATFTTVSPQVSGEILAQAHGRPLPAARRSAGRVHVGRLRRLHPRSRPAHGAHGRPRLDSMGYCGHGLALGSYMGDRIANVIAGKPEDTPFLDLSFRSIPLYRGRPWFLPLAGAYYRAYDRLK